MDSTLRELMFAELRCRILRRRDSHVAVKRLKSGDRTRVYQWPIHLELIKQDGELQHYGVLIGSIVSIQKVIPLDRENEDIKVVVIPYLF